MHVLANRYRRLAEGVRHAADRLVLVASLTLLVSVSTASIGEEH